jgi:hypothetical protein
MRAVMTVMSEASRRPDYERSDASPALLAALAASLGLFVVFTTLGLDLVYPRTALHDDIGPPPNPPAPRLQINPAGDLATLRQAETTQLTNYGWVDRANGRVRIPIDRALALTAERGLPGWTKP